MSSRRNNLLCCLLIIGAGVCAYHNSLHGPFTFDDYPAIVQNSETRSLAASLRPTLEYTAGRPVAVFTFYLNRLVGGANPFGYHVVNLVIHLLVALTVFGLVWRTLVLPKMEARFGRVARGIALMSAVLFVTHPVTTEVVDYVLQRTESLMALMALVTLYWLNRALASPKARAFAALAIVACAIGMGCKQVMVVVPLIALAYDRVFFWESWGQVARRHWRIHLGLFATLAVFLASQLLRRNYESVGMTAHGITPWVYLMTESTVLVHYLRLIFWPYPLVIDYFDWRPAWSLAAVWPQGILIVALLVVSMRGVMRGRPAGFVGMAVFLALAPTSSILPMPSEYIAERRLYLPLAFFLPMVVAGAYVMLRHAVGTSAALFGGVAGAGIVVLFVVMCVARNRDYATDEALWSDTVSKRPGNARAWANYADVLFRENKFEDAVIANRAAIQIDASLPPPHQNLGTILERDGDFDGAAKEFQAALRYHDDPKSRALLANVYARMGRNEEAIAEFRHAVQMNANDAQLHDACGFVLARTGRTREAMGEFTEAIRIDPAMAGAYFDLALAQEVEGDWAAAVKNLRIALSREPEKPLLLRTLAWALAVTPDANVANGEEAVKLVEKCAPGGKADDPEILDTLGAAYARAGRFDDAIAAAVRGAAAAEAGHRAGLAAVIRAREAMYRRHEPFIQARPATRSVTQSHVS